MVVGWCCRMVVGWLSVGYEEKALQLYNELAGKSDKEDFVAVFKVHCREEAKHKQIIETINDYFMVEQGD